MLDLPSGWLVVLFLLGAGVTWVAGIWLSHSTDVFDVRLGLGEALGGLILLALAGTLPELAITISAASQGNLDLAAGNLIGGIGMQTMVLVLCDFAAGPERPLTYLVGVLTPVLEALLAILVVAVVMLGALLPPSAAIGGVVSPASIAIVLIWVAGIAVISRVRDEPNWTVTAPGGHPGRRRPPRTAGRTGGARTKRRKAAAPAASAAHAAAAPGAPAKPKHPYARYSTRRVVAIFGFACLLTLVAGVGLELSAETLAQRSGINGVVFGATFLALATALPEISSGIASVRIGDNALAIAPPRRRAGAWSLD